MSDAPFPAGMVQEIDRFMREDKSPRGLDLYPDLFTSPLFFPLQRQAEMAAMTRLVRDHFDKHGPNTFMEIGTDKGGSLYHWCKAFPTLRQVLAFEIRGTPYSGVFQDTFKEIKFWWGCASHSIAEVAGQGGVIQFLNFKPSIDVLFIDGDKGRMEEDFDTFRPLMSEGGVVMMHDVTDDGPKQAFERVTSRGYKTHLIHDVTDYKMSAERQKSGWPALNPHDGWLRHWRGRSCGVGVIFIPESESDSPDKTCSS
jgi:predicted O-methyltransferase YrrM